MSVTLPGRYVPPADTISGVLPPPSPADRLATAGGRRTRLLDRLQPYARPALAVLVIVLAYRVSFRTLLDSLSLDTPLAHLALVPFIAFGLAVAGSRRHIGPPIHDRQLDWILGVPLVLVALAANFLLPSQLSTEFWVYRVDLISLPFFVAGVIVLLFGTRMLWRMRLGVLFLFLAWPYPYSQVLDRWLVPFTAVTVRVVTAAVAHIPVAIPKPGGEANALFTVRHGAAPFDLSVASECSGANGLLGFILVASAFLLAARGRRLAKFAWLAVGAALVWALNVVRILIIFGAGKRWGQKVAIDGFHPVIGLVVFNAGILVMALLMRRFGLKWEAGAARRGARPGAPLAPPPKAYRPALQAGAIVVAMSALGVGVLNADLRDSDLVTSSLGAPRLASFETSKEKPDGWALNYSNQYDWSKRFFGADSVWRRFVYHDSTAGAVAGPDASSGLRSSTAVIADVITTGDRAAFSNYGIEACYRFHNFKITKRQSVDLGNGVVGGVLTWHDPSANSTTTTLYWHWPIKNGSKTRWERVTLLLVDSPTLTFEIPDQTSASVTKEFQLRVGDLLKGQDNGAVSERLVETRRFLVAFAERMIELRGTTATLSN
jgi:exosortase/archaeosortase family protein